MMRYFYDGTPEEDDGDERAAELADDASGSDASGGDAWDDLGPGEDDDDALDDGSLEEEFPRGDGTADTETVVYCPYCGELNEIAVDPGGGPAQSYIEDCQVCCRPWRVSLAFDAEGRAVASVEAADD